jgi:hypothetical protein
MNRDARLISGILLITVPTIQYGGYFLLRLFSGQMPGMKPSPLQNQFLPSRACACGRAGDSLSDLSDICRARGNGTGVRVAGANRCSAGRHSDSAGVLSFGGVHAGSPEWMDSVVVCGSAGAGDQRRRAGSPFDSGISRGWKIYGRRLSREQEGSSNRTHHRSMGIRNNSWPVPRNPAFKLRSLCQILVKRRNRTTHFLRRNRLLSATPGRQGSVSCP